MIATSIWFWVGFIAFVLAMLALDLGVFNRTPHVVRAREAAIWTAVWVGLALLFALGLAVFETHQAALTFLTGYVIEESLSVDNIFVIVLIFQYFAVPAQYQHRVLFWGILGALIMRGLFIALGAALLARFEWIIYIFGALLVITGIRMAVKQDEEFDASQNPIVKFVRRFLPITHDYHGKHFFAVENGKRYATPLLLVVDELGYLPLEKQTAHLFFQLVSRRYERGSMLITTNQTITQWGHVFGDEMIAAAVLDRVLHHSHVLVIQGDSFRLRQKKRAGLLGSVKASH